MRESHQVGCLMESLLQSLNRLQVIVDTDGVNLTNDGKFQCFTLDSQSETDAYTGFLFLICPIETGNLFYIPETLLEPSTEPAMTAKSGSPDVTGASTSAPTAGGRTIESNGNRGEQESNLTQTEPSEKPSGSSESSQNYLQPVYVPEDQVKKIDHAESLLKEKTQGSTTMDDLKASASADSLDVLEPFAMASTTVSTFAAFPDTDTKLSKYSNNNSDSKKKSTFTVNLGSHITVAYDSAEVTTEDGITTAKNSEFSQLNENDDPFWKRPTTPATISTTAATTTELPRPTPHIFTLQEKQDHMTPTESSLKLTRKQGDDITTIPGLIISTPSSLLRTDTPAKAAKPPSSSVPPYIITTSDVINNEVKFHPSQRPTSAETFSTEFGLRKTDVEPTVQSSIPSKSIYRTATNGAGATSASTSPASPTSTAATTAAAAAFDERAKKRAQQAEVGSPLTNEDPTKKFNTHRTAGNIDFAEGIKIFSTLLLSGLAKSRSDQSTVSPTSPTVFYDSVTEKFPAPGQYSSPVPIPVTANPPSNARSTTPSSQVFISNVPLTFHGGENTPRATKQQSSKPSPANRITPGWQTLSNHHGEFHYRTQFNKSNVETQPSSENASK